MYKDISKTEEIKLEIVGDFLFQFDYVGRNLEVTIPNGFTTDLGSVPSAFRWLISNEGKYDKAYILHDYMYSLLCNGPEITKEDADTILFLNLKYYGLSRFKAVLVYNAVKYFGKSRWRVVK